MPSSVQVLVLDSDDNRVLSTPLMTAQQQDHTEFFLDVVFHSFFFFQISDFYYSTTQKPALYIFWRSVIHTFNGVVRARSDYFILQSVFFFFLKVLLVLSSIMNFFVTFYSAQFITFLGNYWILLIFRLGWCLINAFFTNKNHRRNWRPIFRSYFNWIVGKKRQFIIVNLTMMLDETNLTNSINSVIISSSASIPIFDLWNFCDCFISCFCRGINLTTKTDGERLFICLH